MDEIMHSYPFVKGVFYFQKGQMHMLTHKGTQTITTDRLILRRFQVDDAQAMYNNWANDERVTRFLTWVPHESCEITRQILESWCAAYENLNSYNWVIEFEGTIVGNISVVRISEASECAELGYCMGFDYWRKDIMPEAHSTAEPFSTCFVPRSTSTSEWMLFGIAVMTSEALEVEAV